MKSSIWLGTAFIVLGTSIALVRTGVTKPSTEKTAWKITGDLEETCSCDGACPCWFGNKPTRMNCSGNVAVFISKGHYGKVPLNGLAVAQYIQTPDGKTMMESMGSCNFSYLYIDQKANPEQRQALEAIAMQMLPPMAPQDKTKIQYVPITRTIQGKEHIVKVGDFGEFEAHLVDGGFGGPTKIVNPTLPDPMHKEYLQGMATTQKYNDATHWEFTNSNYMYNNFTVTNKDYEEMAAKMQKMGMGGGGQ